MDIMIVAAIEAAIEDARWAEAESAWNTHEQEDFEFDLESLI